MCAPTGILLLLTTALAAQAQPPTADQRAAVIQEQIARGNYDHAIAEARDWLQDNPSNVRGRLLLVAALIGKHNYADAHVVLDRLAVEQPRIPDVVFQVGVLALNERRFDDADAAFTKGRALDPANLRWLYALVESQMTRNRPDAALALLQTESESLGANPGFLALYGNTAARAAKYGTAVEMYQKALDQSPPDARTAGELWLRIGDAQRLAGNLTDAVDSLRKAQTLLPGNAGVLTSLAIAQDGAGQRKDAAETYEAALKIQPDNVVVLNNLAFLLMQNPADLDRALTLAQRAAQLQPKLPEVKDTLAMIYLAKKMPAPALDLFREILAAEPNRSTYHNHYAQALEESGDKATALREYETARKLNPSGSEAKNLDAAIERLKRP